MKLGICCNFSYPHCGGSEFVLQNVSELLVKQFSYQVNVYSWYCKSEFSHNRVTYIPCGRRYPELVEQINHMDHIFVYSDSFWGMRHILYGMDGVHKIKPNITIALVGMYFMNSAEPEAYKVFKKYVQNGRIKVVTHAKNAAYHKCISDGIPVTVVPNGVNLSEFGNETINFREKYNIEEKYVLLNVSNFFYGKGQEAIPSICKELRKHISRDEFAVVSISSSIDYPYDKHFLHNCRGVMAPYNNYFLRDIPRKDVIAAFKESDVFLFTSKKEVSPLVILESEAAGLPWISMDVGDVRDRRGGMILEAEQEDPKGYKIITSGMSWLYGDIINDLLISKVLRSKLQSSAMQYIQDCDWTNIVPTYHRNFIS